ncbi:hypothetical protein G5I_09734 [Acromyrmex echinatior]|uniref:Uncharacterized protein n=1 Tax=Acromyrmex echinatior TaxID=103372 RepID=F4WV02_ACREC|nr:hypothetical protein G5I_09734 [Acromyrmex echinatior]
MHVTVANERLSLDNYATAPSTCGGAASSAVTTSMHSIKPNDYDISCLKKNVQLPTKSVVLGNSLGHLLSSIDVCRPLVGIRARSTAESEQGHDRQSENPPRAHDSSTAAPTTMIATGCPSFATPASHSYHPLLYISTTNTTATVATACQGSSDTTAPTHVVHLRTNRLRTTESPAARVTRFKYRTSTTPRCQPLTLRRYRPRRRRRDVVAATAAAAFGQRAGAAAGGERGNRQVMWPPTSGEDNGMILVMTVSRALPRTRMGLSERGCHLTVFAYLCGKSERSTITCWLVTRNPSSACEAFDTTHMKYALTLHVRKSNRRPNLSCFRFTPQEGTRKRRGCDALEADSAATPSAMCTLLRIAAEEALADALVLTALSEMANYRQQSGKLDLLLATTGKQNGAVFFKGNQLMRKQ